jgi:polysaccharide deacetylase 2 family uncharacterized protein YibQ
VAADDLTAPLGKNKPSNRRFTLPIPIPYLLAGILGLPLVVFLGWAIVRDDPLGGEPIAMAPSNPRPEASAPADSANSSRPSGSPTTADKTRPNRYDGPTTGEQPSEPEPPAGSKTVTIIDGSSGKRQQVVIPNTPNDKSAPNDKRAASEERLTEPSRHGPLPKISQDGVRPAEAFAQPVKNNPADPDAPRIAIVMGGLGIGATNTSDAIKRLPGPVTFAFLPYGPDIERQITLARGGGHEVLLQVPMEPFDYPDNDPGPQTLLTSLDASQNVDRLQSLMARARGYVGVANFMGSRFSASEQALAPVLRETAKRGLIYFDDGSAPRSLAGQIAGGSSLPFAKSDVAIDTVPSAAEIDRALGRLEALARERGNAIGMANALPITIDRIARWAKAAEARGIQLVPITAIIAKTRSS